MLQQVAERDAAVQILVDGVEELPLKTRAVAEDRVLARNLSYKPARRAELLTQLRPYFSRQSMHEW